MGGFAMRVDEMVLRKRLPIGVATSVGASFLWNGPRDAQGRPAPCGSTVIGPAKPRVRVKAWRRPDEDGHFRAALWRRRHLGRD